MKQPNIKTILAPGDKIKDIYTIDCFIGAGSFSEVYRVKHRFLGLQALKILNSTFLKDGNQTDLFLEAKILSDINHPNVVRIFDANSFEKNDEYLFYISMEYVSGENLLQLINRKSRIDLPLALTIQKNICSGISIAHKQNPPVIHRDIKPQNILLSYDTNPPTAKVADFGIAKAVDKNTLIAKSAGTIEYLAPEGFWGFQDTASDVFSAGIIFYNMITGIPPWTYKSEEIGEKLESIEKTIIVARKQLPLKPSFFNDKCDSKLDEIVLKALDIDQSKRFKDADEFLKALVDYENTKFGSFTKQKTESDKNTIDTIKKGNGFNDVAGMSDLKELLRQEIILPLKQKDIYDKYKIPLPNGILLYGPPGCGKTYISKKLSEEINYHFIEVKPSDLASIYVHGSQEKIGRLFKDAKEKAPSILIFDEIDALIPKRSDNLDHHYSSEVNEFLSQLSDCGKNKIVVIGTTNRPDQIDLAALRTGRFDKLIYIAPPDFEARKELFNNFLVGRPISPDIDISSLSSATDNFVASDIEAIVNEAARKALFEKSEINFKILVDIINSFNPSVSVEVIEFYHSFKIRHRN